MKAIVFLVLLSLLAAPKASHASFLDDIFHSMAGSIGEACSSLLDFGSSKKVKRAGSDEAEFVQTIPVKLVRDVGSEPAVRLFQAVEGTELEQTFDQARLKGLIHEGDSLWAFQGHLLQFQRGSQEAFQIPDELLLAFVRARIITPEQLQKVKISGMRIQPQSE